jgi:hypothetical protein
MFSETGEAVPMRMIETVIRDGPHHGLKRIYAPDLDRHRWQLLRTATPIIADSVYDLYAEKYQSFERDGLGRISLKEDADVWSAERKITVSNIGSVLTNLAPPFENFFVEWRDGLTAGLHDYHGVHFYSFPADYPYFDIEREKLERPWLAEKEWKWLMVADVYQSVNATGRVLGPVMGQLMFVPEDGDHTSTIARQYPEFTNREDQYVFFLSRLEIAHLAIHLMHGESIRVQAEDRPEAWAKNYRKRNGTAPVKYKVLDIKCVREVLEREGQMSETGITRALHVCRGHFRTYQSGKRVWIDEHLRGDPDKGVIEKTYRVNP